jgi:hypothetical protein
MKLSSRVLGVRVVGEISARSAAPLLIIGKDIFHRGDLARVECYNFLAAQRLSTVFAALGVKNTRDVFERVPPTALVLPTIGSVSLAVLGAAFEAKGLGGEQPLEAWVLRHRDSIHSKKEIVTFASMKVQERNREPGETRARTARKNRKDARRRIAHATRVQRFTMRRQRMIHAADR